MKLVEKPINYKNLGNVDISALLPLIQRLGKKLWLSEDSVKENKFDVFHHTQHIIFRFTPQNADPRISYSNPSWNIWSSYLLPIMDKITAQYGHGEIAYSKVMLAKLDAGQEIDAHVDGKGSNLVTHKIHVPIITNSKAIFYIDGKAKHLRAGQAYEVNNIVKHGVKNMGEEDRVHLIFEHYDAAASPKLAQQPLSVVDDPNIKNL